VGDEFLGIGIVEQFFPFGAFAEYADFGGIPLFDNGEEFGKTVKGGRRGIV